jgi:adenylate cyclase class 2
MSYEVEQKYSVAELAGLAARVAGLGAVAVAAVTQVDLYFNHPERDFAVTDEALRIRQVNGSNILTYKGSKLDATTKTRQEIEVSIEPGSSGLIQAAALLRALGYRQVAEVRKLRESFQLKVADHTAEIALDEVERVGTFAELEITVQDEPQIAAARQVLAQLAATLGLENAERRSYLELLLEQGP